MKDTVRIWILTAVVLIGASGCSTFNKDAFTNRLVCTAAKDEGFVASMWGFFGIVTSIDERDINTLCLPVRSKTR